MSKGETDQHAHQDAGWFQKPSQDNPRAILPFYLACFGSYSWETATLWGGANNPVLNSLWEALVLAGAVLLLLGLIGGIIYRHYKTSAFTIIISLISLPLWIWLLLTLHPLLGPAAPSGFPAMLWLYFQLPLVLVAFWRSRWRTQVKAGFTLCAALGLLCVFHCHAVTVQREVDAAPHFSDASLCSIYAKSDVTAIARLNGKKIVVTGIVGGQDEGLFGGGPPKMISRRSGGFIEIDDLGPFDTVEDGQRASILGTCQGEDAQGIIQLTECQKVDFAK